MAQENKNTIQIDGKEYELDALSDAVKEQIKIIQFAENELIRLQGMEVVVKTALNNYRNALKASLPKD